jgi:hypothetical protein
LKEKIESVVLVFVERILGIKVVKKELLYPELAYSIEKEADFVLLGILQNGKVTVYHIEFQSQNYSEMTSRNYMYSALLNLKYRKPIKQIVIYMGNDPLSMKAELIMPDFTFRYELIDMRSFHIEIF